MRLGIVVSRFNAMITSRLLASAQETLRQAGVAEDQLHVVKVPGAFEIPVAAMALAESGTVDGILALGCVIRGETDHYAHISETCAHGIAHVALDTGLPVIFGVLTVDNRGQAEARAGGNLGDAGAEGAKSLMEMVNIIKELISS